MQFLAARKPLAMQRRVDLGCMQVADAVALLPAAAKTIGVVAAAVEAGPMAGRESGGLIQEKQLGPASSAHHFAAAAAELDHANEPGRARPALAQQRFRCGVVDDAAIAGEHAAIGDRDDLAWWHDAVLER